MTLTEVKEKAKVIGVKATKQQSKRDLIRAIQKQEGNSACYQTAIAPACGQTNCLWRQDCLSNSAS